MAERGCLVSGLHGVVGWHVTLCVAFVVTSDMHLWRCRVFASIRRVLWESSRYQHDNKTKSIQAQLQVRVSVVPTSIGQPQEAEDPIWRALHAFTARKGEFCMSWGLGLVVHL